MFKNILTYEQEKLLPLLKDASNDFGLVGGTAIALHLGHRRSVDFDLFTQENFDSDEMRGLIRKKHRIERTFVENPNELTILVMGIKMTFLKYPFAIEFSQNLENVIKLPDLLTLAAMKAFALGKRAKWKDYVDLYFIFKKHLLKEVTQKAREIFKGEFNERLFREQLAYFKDIDYSENIDYLKGFEKSDEEIKQSLTEVSLQ